MSTTESERLFQELCNRSRIRWHKIKTSSKRTPDQLVRLRLGSPFVLVEVNELHPDKEETKAIADAAERGWPAVLGATPGTRARPLINATAQPAANVALRMKRTVLLFCTANNIEKHAAR